MALPGVLRERREQRREHRHQDDQQGEPGAPCEERVPPEPRDDVPPPSGRSRLRTSFLESDDRAVVGSCRVVGHQVSRILGSMSAWTTSTSVFPMTYTIATKSVTPTIAGVSSAETASAA